MLTVRGRDILHRKDLPGYSPGNTRAPLLELALTGEVEYFSGSSRSGGEEE